MELVARDDFLHAEKGHPQCGSGPHEHHGPAPEGGGGIAERVENGGQEEDHHDVDAKVLPEMRRLIQNTVPELAGHPGAQVDLSADAPHQGTLGNAGTGERHIAGKPQRISADQVVTEQPRKDAEQVDGQRDQDGRNPGLEAEVTEEKESGEQESGDAMGERHEPQPQSCCGKPEHGWKGFFLLVRLTCLEGG